MAGYDTGQTGSSTTDKAKEKVQETTQQVQERAGEMTQQARGRLGQEVDSRSTQAGDGLRSTAMAMRRTSEQLRNEGKEGPAKLSDAVAERADRLGGYLTGTSGDQMLRQVEDFARRQPWLIAAGGMLLGFVASRFLKASSSKRYGSSYDRYADQGTSSFGYTPGYTDSPHQAMDLPTAPPPPRGIPEPAPLGSGTFDSPSPQA